MNSYIPLDTVRIASPCSASWDAMTGDDRVRHCDDCNLSVYNISEMTREAAEALVSGAEGRLCIRMYQRFDGTIITQDCPVGARRIRARMVRRIRAVAAVTLTFIGGTAGVTWASGVNDIKGRMAAQTEVQRQDTTASQDTVETPHIMMGGMRPMLDYRGAEPDGPVDVVTPEEPVQQIYEVMGEMMAIEPADTAATVTPVQEPVDDIVIDDVTVIEMLPEDQPLPEPVRVEPDRVEPVIR
jgi:hypothetical protein